MSAFVTRGTGRLGTKSCRAPDGPHFSCEGAARQPPNSRTTKDKRGGSRSKRAFVSCQCLLGPTRSSANQCCDVLFPVEGRHNQVTPERHQAVSATLSSRVKAPQVVAAMDIPCRALCLRYEQIDLWARRSRYLSQDELQEPAPIAIGEVDGRVPVDGYCMRKRLDDGVERDAGRCTQGWVQDHQCLRCIPTRNIDKAAAAYRDVPHWSNDRMRWPLLMNRPDASKTCTREFSRSAT